MFRFELGDSVIFTHRNETVVVVARGEFLGDAVKYLVQRPKRNDDDEEHTIWALDSALAPAPG